MGERRRGAGPLPPHLDPGLNQRLVHPGGHAQLDNVPVPGSVNLVLAITEGQAGALSQQGGPPGGGLLELGDCGGFLFGGQPPAGSGRCRRRDDGCDEKTIGGEAAHEARLELVFESLQDPSPRSSELTSEAIRLTREVRRLLPEDGEVTGLLALMLLTDARRAARTRVDGSLVPLAEQDRKLWNHRISSHHRLDAVRAHLLEMAGDRAAARATYRSAARRTTSLPERRYLEARAARLSEEGGR